MDISSVRDWLAQTRLPFYLLLVGGISWAAVYEQEVGTLVVVSDTVALEDPRWAEDSPHATQVARLTPGERLRLLGHVDGAGLMMHKVRLPDGRSAFVVSDARIRLESDQPVQEAAGNDE